MALIGTLILTAVVLALPTQDDSPRRPRVLAGSDSSSSEAPSSSPPVAEAGQLWRQFTKLDRPQFAEAESDPFADTPAVVAASPMPVASPLVEAPFMGPPTPPPPPPPLVTQFRILGWLRVDGQNPQLFLTNGQEELVARVGTALPDGFVVQELSARGVLLRHPPTQTAYLLPLPDSLPPTSASTLRGP